MLIQSRIAAVLLLFACTSSATEIHRCELPDGTFSFQETPCTDPAAKNDEPDDEPEAIDSPSSGDDAFDFVNPFDEPEEAYIEPELPQPVSAERAECEKITRDAIDEIDLEMRSRSYSDDEARAYLAELRVLTQQLRACKRIKQLDP